MSVSHLPLELSSTIIIRIHFTIKEKRGDWRSSWWHIYCSSSTLHHFRTLEHDCSMNFGAEPPSWRWNMNRGARKCSFSERNKFLFNRAFNLTFFLETALSLVKTKAVAAGKGWVLHPETKGAIMSQSRKEKKIGFPSRKRACPVDWNRSPFWRSEIPGKVSLSSRKNSEENGQEASDGNR